MPLWQSIQPWRGFQHRSAQVLAAVLMSVMVIVMTADRHRAYGQSAVDDADNKPLTKWQPRVLFIPGEAAKTLDESSITEIIEQMSLESFIEIAVKHSVRSKILASELEIRKNSLLKHKGLFDPVVTSDLSFTNSQPDRFPRPERDSFQSLGLNSRITQNFSQGTSLSLMMKAATQETVMSATPELVEPTFTTAAGISLSQSLTRNVFGKTWSLQENLARQNYALAKDLLMTQMDQLVGLITRTFFELKTQQLHYQSLIDQSKKNSEILSTAKLLYRRGNVEQADLLNIEARYLNAMESQKEALVKLKNTWFVSLANIGIPQKYTSDIKVESVNLPYSSLQDSPWRKICVEASAPQESVAIWQGHHGYQTRKKRYELASTQVMVVSDQMKPDLSLGLSYTLSNVDGELATSFGDTLNREHGAFTASLQLQWTLGNSKVEAELRNSTLQAGKARLDLEAFTQTQLAELQNSCRMLEHLTKRRQSLKSIADKQRQRAKIQRKLFDIGREDFFTATEGEITAIRAKFQYDAMEFRIEGELQNLLILSGRMVGTDSTDQP